MASHAHRSRCVRIGGHARNEGAEGFYRHHGFALLPGDELRLFLSFATAFSSQRKVYPVPRAAAPARVITTSSR